MDFNAKVLPIEKQVSSVDTRNNSPQSIVHVTNSLSREVQDFAKEAGELASKFAGELAVRYRKSIVTAARRGKLAGKKTRFEGAVVPRGGKAFGFVVKGEKVVLHNGKKKVLWLPGGRYYVVDGMDTLGQLHLDVCNADGTKHSSKAVTIVGPKAHTVYAHTVY